MLQDRLESLIKISCEKDNGSNIDIILSLSSKSSRLYEL